MNKQPAPAGPASGRIEFLDFAKGCAMLSIVLFHYFRGYFPGLGDKAVMVGGAGVHLFLLLSGFGLALSTQRLAAFIGDEPEMITVCDFFGKLHPADTLVQESGRCVLLQFAQRPRPDFRQ